MGRGEEDAGGEGAGEDVRGLVHGRVKIGQGDDEAVISNSGWVRSNQNGNSAGGVSGGVGDSFSIISFFLRSLRVCQRFGG